ncbi:MAG: hypothetical protein A2Y38_00655 [Spirochaetes bacterium GWB1_59_5]|nr:MAG: hypothetical protein A2Y38_00655 [Spirochaetes bacterium GWB1_59_5]
MEQTDYRLAAIMYTDIVGFSRMMERDEAGTLDILRYHNTLVTDLATKRHGTVIKTIGDAFLVDFRNTVEALQCAMDIQAAIYEHNKEGKGQPLLLRIGLHLGDIYFFENDALGEGINIASRLQSFARPGCICFSQDVYNQVLNKIDFRADKLGKVSLKNITKEIHGYEIVSPNIEFDPDRDKPRPGFKPIVAEEVLPEPAATPLPGMPSPADRGYSPEAAREVLDDIRKAILEDTRRMGRRLTVDEALARYGEYGVEAKEVIATMTEKGLIQKRPAPGSTRNASPEPEFGTGGQSGSGATGTSGTSDLAADIGKAVEGIARAIEQSVGDWQKSGGHGSRGHEARYDDIGRRVGNKAERVIHTLEQAADRVDFAFDEKRALKAEYKRHETEVGTGKWDKELRGSEHFKPGTEELETDFDRYRDKIDAKAHKSTTGFIGNLLSFIGVNAFLWYINLNVAPGFMWAAIVSASWGTGIVSGFFAMLRGKAKAAEVDKMPQLRPDALDVYKKIHRVRDGMAMHFASVISVPPLLFTINLLTSPGFLWAAIPSGIMALSFLGHLISYPGTLRGLEKKLCRLLGVDSWRELFRLSKGRNAAAGPYASIYAEVATIRDEIVRDLKAGKGSDEFGKDMIPTLDKYVEQVKLLSHSVNEIDGIVSTIPMDALKRDREALETKRASAGNQALKDEYGRSIAEIARQEKACTDLEDQRELLRLRLGSSANALKQLKIDMARMKALPEAGERQALEEIRKKASELSGYLADLKTGYEETAADPYAELERLAAEADARAKLEGPAGNPAPSGR